MKFSFQAGLHEYWDRRSAFIKSLAHKVGAFDSDLAEILEKALPQKEPQLKWKLLRELQGQTKIAYQEQIKKMLDEVNKVLEQSAPKGLRKAFEHIEPGDQEPKEYQTEEDKQFENEYDQVTGEPRPEPEEEPEEPEEEEEPELEASVRARDDLKKAGGPYIGPRGGKWADPEHTISWEESEGKSAAHNGVFRYGAALRPVSHANVPPGAKHEPHKAFRHGLAVYDRPLTAAEVKSYELTPILNEQAVEERVNRVLDEMYEYADEYRELQDTDPKTLEMTVRQALERQGPAHYDVDVATKRVIAGLNEPGKNGALVNPKVGDKIPVSMHPAIVGGGGRQVDFRVVAVEGDKVKVAQHAGTDYGPWMPKASLSHFQNDLAGKVNLPPSGNPDIDAVTSGHAIFLGKGDDGLAFRVGDKVVKVSTTVPYQPENPGHRTPDEAVTMLQKQVAIGNEIVDAGVSGIQRSKFVKHGDKGFQIKPWVTIPSQFSREQLDALQDIMIAMHAKGYALNDAPQAGLDARGQVVMFDVGKAAKNAGDPKDRDSNAAQDMERLSFLYRKNKEKFVRRDYSEGQQHWEHYQKRVLEWVHGKKYDFARNNLKQITDKLQDEAKATLKGTQLDAALKKISAQHAKELEFLDSAAKGNPSEIKKSNEFNKALYIGPRGGKWADPEHTISWSPEMDRRHQRQGEVPPGHIAHVIAEHGGKITAHHTDPNQAMVKVPHEHAQVLKELQFELGLPHVEPVKGGKYTMITIPKSHVEAAPTVQKPAAVKPEIPDIKAPEKTAAIMKIIEQIPLHVVPHKTNPAMVMIKTPQDHKAGLAQLAATLGINADSIQVGGQNAMLPIGKPEAKVLIAAMQGMAAITGAKKPTKKPAPSAPAAPKPQATPKSAPPGAVIAEIPAYVQAQHWAPADTMEQAQDWFKNAGVKASFPDLPTANAVSDALRRSHPAVIKHCQFIGTSAQLKAWMKSNPELAAEAKMGKHATDLTKQSPLGGTAVAIAHPIGAKPYTKSVVIVQDSWWDAHKAEKEGQLEHGGFSLSKNLRDVVIHELGHVEGFALRHLKVGDSTAWEVWKKHVVPVLKDPAKKKQFMQDVSQYAATTPHEAWAEIAVMRRKGMQVPEWVQAAIDEMGIDKTPWDTMSTGWKWGG